MIFSLIFISFTGIQAKAEEKLALKVEAGFNSTYKINNTVPIKVQIDNNLKNINGELQVEVETSQIEYQNNVTIYAQNISLPMNSSKSITINVPIIKYITKLTVNIVEGKNTIITKEISIPGGLNSDSMLIGILSDNFDSVSYINDIKFSAGRTYSVKNVKLDEKIMPENSDVLKSFDVLVVNDFDTSKLNDAQYLALKTWVNEGGMLLIGTGTSYNKTLSVFKKDNFISGEIGEVKDISTAQLYKFVEDNVSPAVKLPVLSADIKDSTQVVKEGNLPLVFRLKKGKGAVVIAAFDFGMNPIANWSQKGIFASKLIGLTLPDYYTAAYAMKGMAMGKDPYMISSAVRNLAELSYPKGKNLSIIFFIYILLAAPVNYYILKRLDKREWMWITVPVLSAVFGIIMFIFGFSTRITEPIANVFTNITLDSKGNNTTNVYAGIFTPSKKDIKVEGSSGTNIKPVPTYNYGYMRPDTSNKPPKYIEAKVYTGQKSSIEFYDNTIFSNKVIALENGAQEVGKLSGNINYTNLTYTGEVINDTGYDLSEAYILTGNNYIVLGSIKNGEKKSVSDKGNYYNGFINEFTNKIYKNPYMSSNPQLNLTDEEIKEYRINEQKRAALNILFQGDNMKVSEPKIIGFIENSLSKDIIVNGKKVKKYEKTVIAAPLALTFNTGDIVEYPLGYIKPKVTANNMKGGYDEVSMRLFGSGTFEIIYDITKTIKVDKIQTSFSIQNGASSDAKLYLWNSLSGVYEEASFNTILEKDNLVKYLDKNNILKMKVEITNMNANAEVPSISVRGSVK